MRILNIKIDKPHLTFVIARVFTLLSKFTLLWVLIKFERKDASELLALYYLAFASLMLLLSNEAQFNFYKAFFDEGKRGILLVKYQKEYIKLIFYHVLFFLPLLFIFSYILTNSFLLSLCFCALLLLEKWIDEIIRFKLFVKDFIGWSKIMFYKVSIPTVIVFVFAYLDYGVFFAFVISSFLTYTIIVILKTPKIIFKYFYNIIRYISYFESRLYIKLYLKKHIYDQFFSITSTSILSIDKWMIKLLGYLSLLDQYTLIGQLANMVNIFIDFFFVSTRRALYVKKITSIKELTSGFKLPIIGFLGIAGFSLITYVFLELNAHIDIAYEQALLMGFSFLIFGLTMPFSQFCFWHESRKKLIIIDLIFILIVIINYYTIFNYDTISNIILSMFIANIVRFTLLFSLSSIIIKKYKKLIL